MRIGQRTLTLTAATLLAVSAQADQQLWVPASGDFSNSANWFPAAPTPADAPTFNNDDVGALGNQTMNVDVDATVERIYNDWNAGGYVNTISGPGTLTVQGNATQNYLGISNRSGKDGGGTLRLAGNIEINRPFGNGFTEIRNDNGANNVIELTPSSVLTLSTPLMALDFTSGNADIQFNGSLAGAADLHIQTIVASINAGHDSSAFGGNFFFNSASKLTINGGTVLSPSQSFTGNYGTGELELNGANAVNGGNFRVWGSTSLLIDANSAQNNMGAITQVDPGALLTINIDDLAGGELWFAGSSGSAWEGSVAVEGFRPGVIRFGTDAAGLTGAQLAAIDSGAYFLDSQGYLIPEPATIGLLLIGGMGVYATRRRKR